MYFDGSKHQSSVGVEISVVSPMDKPTKFLFELVKDCSNNKAEYKTLIFKLEILIEKGIKNFEIIMDS